MRTWFKSQFSGISLGTLFSRAVFFISLAALTLSGCARTISVKTNEDDNPPTYLERVTLVGLNDLHAALLPVETSALLSNEGKTVRYSKGGAALLSSYLQLARAKYPTLLTFAAGDFLFGTYESFQDSGTTVVQTLNDWGVSAAVLGPRDLDFGLVTLKSRMKEAKFPFVLSNLEDSTDAQLSTWPNATRSTVLMSGQVRVGVIGLVTGHFRIAGRTYLFPKLSVIDSATSVRKEVHSLRNQGAQVIVLLAHAGIDCDSHKTNHGSNGFSSPKTWKPETPQEACISSGELVQLLNALPENTIDAAISGNSLKLVHHWVKGVPVIQAGSNGEYFNLIHLFYDRELKKIRQKLTRIEGPFGNCLSVFSNQLDCNERRPLPKAGRGDLLRASFLGQQIETDDALKQRLLLQFAKLQSEGSKPIAEAINDVPLDPTRESALGNLVADAIRNQLQTDFAVLSPGALRASISKGAITERELFSVIPFELSLAKLTLTGLELKNLLTILSSGARGFPSVSGLKLNLIDLQYPGRSKDLNGDRKIEHWEFDRLLAVRNSSGTQLRDFKKYTVATTDFIARGGDDLGWLISQLSSSSIELKPDLSLRKVLANWLKTMGRVNTEQTPLLEPGSSRIKLSVPPAKPGRRRTKRRAASTR